MKNVRVLENIDREQFENEILAKDEPIVLKNQVSDWPSVRAVRETGQLNAYLDKFATNSACQVIFGEPEINGRFSYSEDLKGFNFKRKNTTFFVFLEKLTEYLSEEDPPSIYGGSMHIPKYLPGFEQENTLALVDKNVVPNFGLGTRPGSPLITIFRAILPVW